MPAAPAACFAFSREREAMAATATSGACFIAGIAAMSAKWLAPSTPQRTGASSDFSLAIARMVYRWSMPTNKLWIEHTERAAWDSVEALRERLVKAEARLQALAPHVHQLPQLLDALEHA